MNKSAKITDSTTNTNNTTNVSTISTDMDRVGSQSTNITEIGTNYSIKASRISHTKARPTKPNLGRVGGMKKSAEELISETSLHGFVKIFGVNKHILQRLIWALIAIVSYAYFAKLIIRNVEEYYEFPVITNINQVYEKEPEFPMISFCDVRGYLCQFNGQRCQNVVEKARDNEICTLINGGKSVSYHELPISKAEKPGRDNGLYLVIAPGTSDIKLYINNQSVTYNPDKAIRVSVGMETSLVISRVFTSKLSHPYSNCQNGYAFDLGSDDHFNRSFYPYFQSECFNLCIKQKFFEALNKSEEYFQNFQYYFTNFEKWERTTGTNNHNYYLQYPEVYDNISIQYWYILGKNKFCEDICPIECNSISYTLTPYYRSNGLSYATVWIYYEDFTYTVITEIPKITPDNLFGNIGGILGLFLGASLLSVFEIAEFFLMIFLKLLFN